MFMKNISNKFLKLNQKKQFSLFKLSTFLFSIKSPLNNITKKSFPLKSLSVSTFATTTPPTDNKSFEDSYKTFEENMKKADKQVDLIMSLLKQQSLNNSAFFNALADLIKIPLRMPENFDLEKLLESKVDQISFTNNDQIRTFCLFLDMIDYETSLNIFQKIEKTQISTKLEQMDIDTLIDLCYSYSKYQIKDENIWKLFRNQTEKHLKNLDVSSLSKIFLSYTMAGIQDENLDQHMEKIFREIEGKINKITFLDASRICIGLTKKSIKIEGIKPFTWKKLQQVFIENIHAFDLYQISQILLLFCEIPEIEPNLYSTIESDITKEYLEQFDKQSDKVPEDFNMSGFLDHLSKISFAFALNRQGSLYFWKKIMNLALKYKDHTSNVALENFIFVAYRLPDMLVQLNEGSGAEGSQISADLNNLLNFIEEKILKENLLTTKKIDPFNTMMPFARMARFNEPLWNQITTIFLELFSNEEFVLNPFLLADLTFCFSNYYNYLNHTPNINKANNVYYNNINRFWEHIGATIANTNPEYFEIPHISNLIVDLSQIELELAEAWSYLTSLLRRNIDKLDKNNFVMILMGLSKKDYESPELWKDLEKFAIKKLNQFNLDELRKIIICFLKIENTQELWTALNFQLADPMILKDVDLNYLIDLEIPLALMGINNAKIWERFEEVVMKNLKSYKEDKELLINSVYSFSKVHRGSQALWNYFSTFVSNNLEKYEIDDLSHLGICLRPSHIKAEKIHSKDFWDKFGEIVRKNIHKANLNTCNNILKALSENEFTKNNKDLLLAVETRIDKLIKDLPK